MDAVTKRAHNYRHDIDDEKLVEMYVDKGLSSYTIAREYGVSNCCIINRLKAVGVKLRTKADYDLAKKDYGGRSKP